MISKSKYMRGEQCLKALWLSVNKPKTADDTSNISTQQGNAVGECARHYFSDSVTIQLDNFSHGRGYKRGHASGRQAHL